MTDPTRHRQLEELNRVELCTRILFQARNELYMNMHFLDLALSSLGFEADWARRGLAWNRAVICYGPDYLLDQYKKGRAVINRAYLHMLFHCLFCHMYTRKGRDKRLWDLSCDIAMESVIDGIPRKCIRIPPSALRRETYLRFKKALDGKAMTAERVYRALTDMNLPERRIQLLEAEFYVDSHELWEEDEDPRQAVARQRLWNDNREKMQTELETMGSEDPSEEDGSLQEVLEAENRERHDYRQFLRRFSVMQEELKADEDAFDTAFYTYGLSLYGNMPLIEPLETREVRKIQDFVIVIDTSMSCSGELVQRFLEETYEVLSETESYFKKVHIRIIQCDDRVRSDVKITSSRELQDYMKECKLQGLGGTDFRPAFAYAEGLKAAGEFRNLKGLIYFTDGKGIYPVKAPSFDAAFIFIENMYSGEAVPPWAIQVVLEEEQLTEYRTRSEEHEH